MNIFHHTNSPLTFRVKRSVKGTSVQKETKFMSRKRNVSWRNSHFNSQLDRHTPDRDEQHYWPRVQPMELSSSKEIAMHQLVRRVKQRRNGEHRQVMGKSPMIIKAYRPPRAPYIIQQQSLMKRVMVVRPSFEKNTRKGVKQRLVQPKKSPAETLISTKVTGKPEKLELKTWRPALRGEHHSHVLPSAEDRYVQNYKLQMQQAAKFIDTRYTHTVSDCNKNVYNKNPLPPIRIEQPTEIDDDSDEHEDQNDTVDIQENNMNPRDENNISKSMEQMNVQKEKWKFAEGDAYDNNLRTKHKFTSAKRQFKDELERIRELSAIREDLSSLGDHASVSNLASIHSASSMTRIDEHIIETNKNDMCIRTADEKMNPMESRTENEMIIVDTDEVEQKDINEINQENKLDLNQQIIQNTENSLEPVEEYMESEECVENYMDIEHEKKEAPVTENYCEIQVNQDIGDFTNNSEIDRNKATDCDYGYYRFLTNDQIE